MNKIFSGPFFKNLKGSTKKIQYCGTIMIYCGSGSGSYFGKVLVSVPVPVPIPVPVPDPGLFSTLFNSKNFVQNLTFSKNARSGIFSQKVGQ
jgi:hypothetical protein